MRDADTAPVWRGKGARWASSSIADPCAGRRSPWRHFARPLLPLIVLGVVCALIWRLGVPAWSMYRSSAAIESAATSVVRRLPSSVDSEAELRVAVQAAAVTPGNPTGPVRWYVCFGQRGDVDDLQVARDDGLDRTGRAFVERLVDEGRLGGVDEGKLHDVFTFPRGAVWRTVAVDGRPWCVVVGWDESR
jgi:hypothetical protein